MGFLNNNAKCVAAIFPNIAEIEVVDPVELRIDGVDAHLTDQEEPRGRLARDVPSTDRDKRERRFLTLVR